MTARLIIRHMTARHILAGQTRMTYPSHINQMSHMTAGLPETHVIAVRHMTINVDHVTGQPFHCCKYPWHHIVKHTITHSLLVGHV